MSILNPNEYNLKEFYNPFTTLIPPQRKVTDYERATSNISLDPAKLTKAARSSIIMGGAYLNSVLLGHHRFFAGCNVRNSFLICGQRHFGIYDYLTLGIAYALENTAGRGCDYAADQFDSGTWHGIVKGIIVGFPSVVVKFPLAVVRWVFGVVADLCFGWVLSMGMKFRAANQEKSKELEQGTGGSNANRSPIP